VCAFEGGQGLDRFARLLLRQANFIEALQIQPKLRRGPKEMCQAQGGVAGDRAASMEDFGNAVGRNVEPARQLSRAHVQLAQFFGEVFAGMDGGDGHKCSPSESKSALPGNRLEALSGPLVAIAEYHG